MPNKKKTAEKKQGKRMGIFPLLLLLIFIGSLTASGYLLYGEINKELGIKDMETNIQTFVKPSSNTQASDNTEITNEDTYVFDWDGMLEQSEYVIGWIQIPGIERINYPIVQHPDDNQFFLTHDWKGNYQTAGAIFMNRYNTPDFTDMNTVIYGHRMKTGSMFGSLKQYASQNFLDENAYFHIYTPDGIKRTYEIICYSSVTDASDAYMMHFSSPNERLAYYEMMVSKAITKRNVELGEFDTTVMFSTCNNTGNALDRLTVLGKLVAIDLNGQPEDWKME